MKKRVFVLLAVFAFVGLVTPAPARDIPQIEEFDTAKGWINWDRQVVKAIGYGVLPGDVESEAQARLMGRAAAIADAYRHLAMAVSGVRVAGETCVRNFVTESDEVRMKVEGFVCGAHIVSERELPDRSFEVILQVPVVGRDGLMSNLASEILPYGQAAPDSGEDTPTGLIIDARGLGVKPAMSPKVYDQAGREVYGTVKVSPDYAIEVGVAAYPRSMEQALKSPRAGSDPLIVKALRRGPKFATDVVVSDSDAARIREVDRRTGILSRCQVSILIGRRARR